ncbi:hypothetical protein [Parvularcula oceani]|uniref:hypothetical protein n=1 Tax=Parvularcula oceani TaxID=1247963 RepID=UPI00056BF1FA|nr:hypothetical protein [Parvularcula oceani]
MATIIDLHGLSVLLALLVLAAGRLGLLGQLANRPVTLLGAGIAGGFLYRRFGLPTPDPEAVRQAARLGLAVLVFMAAQQCRLSRLPRLSPAALRLVVLAAPSLIVAGAGVVFALLPGLGLWSAILVGTVLPLGVGGGDEREVLRAPIANATKRTVRLDSALSLVLMLPLALLVEAAGIAPAPYAPFSENVLYEAFAGAAVGGTLGLLAGRLLPVRGARLPAAPLFTLGASYAGALLLGFDGVLAAASAGLLYAQEAPLRGTARSRLFEAGRQWCTPLAVFGLGAILGPSLFQADLLVWLAALLPVLLLRGIVRSAALGAVDARQEDRTFLSWFGGAPAAGAALLVLSLLGSPSVAAQEGALGVAAVSVFAGIVVTRLSSRPLVTRLVHQTARARKRRYIAA